MCEYCRLKIAHDVCDDGVGCSFNQDEQKEKSFQDNVMFEEKDPFDFLDTLLDALTEDQLCLLEQRVFSAITRKREQEKA